MIRRIDHGDWNLLNKIHEWVKMGRLDMTRAGTSINWELTQLSSLLAQIYTHDG